MLEEMIYKFSGDDHQVIAQCDHSTKNRFMLIGAFIPGIFGLCCLSSYFAFQQVFNNCLTGLGLSLFFSLMIMNIYLLLLYTLSKDTLSNKYKATEINVSFIIRLGFVCFISIIVSKPIESRLYATGLDQDIEGYKASIKRLNYHKIKFYYEAQINEIKKLSDNPVYIRQFVKSKNHDRLIATAKMYYLVDSSDYYLQRLDFLSSRYPSCWLVTLFSMLIFFLPVYVKYKKIGSSYYDIKGNYEKRKVLLAYYVFKKKYTYFFEKRYNKHIQYSEPYEDAPFNTARKRDGRMFLNNEFFLSELYNDKA